MKNLRKFSLLSPLAILIFMVVACNMSTANLSSLTSSKDKEGKEPSSTFKSGDTLFANAAVANNPGKVKVNFSLVTAEDVEGFAKGEILKGSEVSLDIDGDAVAYYSVPVSEGFPAGKYKLNADMVNDTGEKKGSKTVDVTIEKSADSGETPPSEDAPAKDAVSQ